LVWPHNERRPRRGVESARKMVSVEDAAVNVLGVGLGFRDNHALLGALVGSPDVSNHSSRDQRSAEANAVD
jgi:hypothetical protein